MDPSEFPVPDEMNAATEKATILLFHQVGVVKFGSFILKSGGQSPIYVDFREIISYPRLLQTAERMISAAVRQKDVTPYQVICGVPYAALPIATLMACNEDLPMVMRRKETKTHGTKRVVEGKITPGEKCLIVDDVCTSGSSILETAEDLRKVGLVVEDAVVLLDRENGGKEFLQQNGIRLHSALTITKLCNILTAENKISGATFENVKQFISDSRPKLNINDGNGVQAVSQWKTTFFGDRKSSTSNSAALRLFDIMSKKKTCLAVAADLTTADGILQFANAVAPHICILKLHADIIEDFSMDFVAKLRKIADEHDFLIMEDRKFADIGFTAERQFTSGLHRIIEWADLITIHAIPGEGIIAGMKEAAKKVSNKKEVGIVLIAQMSSKGNLTSDDYASQTVKIAEKHLGDVTGFVCQSDITSNPGFIRMTPGVSLGEAGDTLGQQYSLPQDAMANCADVIIVGRGITKASDPAAAAAEYQTKSFSAYLSRVG